jgi:RNA polymerase sigma-70 factor (ECF subfamily)
LEHHDKRLKEPDAFHEQLKVLLPKLLTWALALTRNRADAEDLAQGAIVNALAARDTFEPGTNFVGWMYRILRNLFLSERARQRYFYALDDMPDALLAQRATQDEKLVLQAAWRSFARLPAQQHQALMLVAVQALSYEAAAGAAGCAVGTMKSRVFHARRSVQVWLLEDDNVLHPSVLRHPLGG